jgi:hypothetical protein
MDCGDGFFYIYLLQTSWNNNLYPLPSNAKLIGDDQMKKKCAANCFWNDGDDPERPRKAVMNGTAWKLERPASCNDRKAVMIESPEQPRHDRNDRYTNKVVELSIAY